MVTLTDTCGSAVKVWELREALADVDPDTLVMLDASEDEFVSLGLAAPCVRYERLSSIVAGRVRVFLLRKAALS